MKHPNPFSTLLCCFVALSISTFTLAQCPTCIPDESCTSANGFPAVCPLVPPDGVAGQYYEEQLTFYLPTEVVDPQSNITVTLLDVNITSVTGLPYGIQFTINDDDATYHPVDGENYGCATLCGTPLIAGTYDIVITVTSNIQVSVFNTVDVRTFISTVHVLPGEGNANTFSYDNIADCGALQVNYEALFSAPDTSVTTYAWDFGNGQEATGQTPGTVTYDNPGTYTTVLTTSVMAYALGGVSVSGLNDNWGGDEDFFSGPADPYFNVLDADDNVIYTSATLDNTNATSWANPQLLLSAPPYYIQFFDADDITPDDNLGSVAIDIALGVQSFDIGNGTAGTYSIDLITTNTFMDSVTVSVFPDAATEIFQNGNTLYLPDTTLTAFAWYQNGLSINEAFDSSYVMPTGGVYYAEVTNGFGCVSTTQSILYCPELNLSYDAGAMELSVDDIYETYQWYFNGLPIQGATSFYYLADQSGNYALDVTTDYGCTTTTEVYTLLVGIDGGISRENTRVYPVPAEDKLFLETSSALNNNNVLITDITGSCVKSLVASGNSTRLEIIISSLTPGIYFAEINHQKIRFIKK